MAEVDIDSPESWSIARQYSTLLSPIPASVCDCIHSLWTTHSDNLKSGAAGYTDKNVDAIKRVDKSAKLKTPLYFAASSLFPERFQDLQEDDSSKALLQILGPGLFATFLGLVYVHRRISKLSLHPNWPTYSKELVLNMELGYIFGSCFPSHSMADGTLANGIRYAALSAFFLHSPDNYVKYRNLRKQKLILEEEHTRWGCDHTQVASFLLRDLGYKSDVMESVIALRKISQKKFALPDDLAPWSAALYWIDLLKEKKDAVPSDEFRNILGVKEENILNLHTRVNLLLQKGATFEWMLKAKE